MGNMARVNYAVEGWRLLHIAGIVFVMFMFVQYLQLPYGHVLSSLFLAGKVETVSTSNVLVGNSSNTLHTNSPLAYMNSTSSNAKGSSNSFTSLSTLNESDLSDGKIVFPEDELPSNDTAVLDTVSTNFTRGRIDTRVDDVQPRDSGSKFPESGNGGESVDSSSVVKETPVSTSPDQSFDLNSLPVVNNSASATNTINELPLIVKEKSQVLDTAVNFTLRCLPGEKKKIGCPKSTIMPISEMNDLMARSLRSSRLGKPRWSSSADSELLKVRSLIENSPEDAKDTKLYAPLYRNISMFSRSYSLMEKTLKVYIYKEGDKPVFHTPVLRGIYASEGWFMKLLKAHKNFVTKYPKKAHLFYLPFSSRMLEETLYVPNSHTSKNLIQYLEKYISLISSRYRFWNRTDGADHFLVACHDWAPSETRHTMERSIRSLCNADVTNGFKFGKDVSLPETYIKSAKNPLRQLGGEPASKRKFLAFFAGNMHGYLRPLLLEYWQNREKDMKIFGTMARADYVQHMKSSKYCICARGYEVNSPRVVEAIFYDCVPVMISDNFVPPLFESLNWESFAVFVAEKDIPNLRNILISIPQEKYEEMQRRVKMVQRHFLWHPKPVKYDAFHMILHSIWFTKVFQTVAR